MTETGIIDGVFATINPDQGAVRAVRYNGMINKNIYIGLLPTVQSTTAGVLEYICALGVDLGLLPCKHDEHFC